MGARHARRVDEVLRVVAAHLALAASTSPPAEVALAILLWRSLLRYFFPPCSMILASSLLFSSLYSRVYRSVVLNACGPRSRWTTRRACMSAAQSVQQHASAGPRSSQSSATTPRLHDSPVG